jgi:acyl-CoA thioesterase-2
LWFHRAVSVDDWIMYDCNSPTIGGARGFSRGEFYSGTTGKLVATVVQEGLMRQVRA